MAFGRFGKVSYTSQTRLQEFVRFLEHGKIVGTRCKRCDRIEFPPRADCAKCLSSDFEWVELTGKGKLVTLTLNQFAPTTFKGETQYTLAVARLDEGPKVFARLRAQRGEGLKAGSRVRLVPVKLSEDKLSYELVAESSAKERS